MAVLQPKQYDCVEAEKVNLSPCSLRVKKHAIHSSDTSSSSDEERFERRKGKSMTRARNR